MPCIARDLKIYTFPGMSIFRIFFRTLCGEARSDSFHCLVGELIRGVRQGDHMSPILFNIVVDSMSVMVKMHNGVA
jgi:hypothetical protein